MPSSECTEVPDPEVLLCPSKSGHLQQLSVYSSLTPLCFCHLVRQVIGNATGSFQPQRKKMFQILIITIDSVPRTVTIT